MRRGAAIPLLVAAFLAGCEFPADVEGTLDRVEGGTLTVGVTHADPWVIVPAQGEPTGVEPELVRRFAETVDAEIEWVRGTESELMEALHGRQLDIVVAGLDRQSAWSKEVTLTRPYLTELWVIAGPDQDTADALSEDLGDQRVAVEANTGIAAKLAEDTDATVVPVEDIAADADGPVAIESWLLDDLDLVASDAELDEHEHAMAVSHGENAFLVKLERFLLDNEAEAAEILEREGKP